MVSVACAAGFVAVFISALFVQRYDTLCSPTFMKDVRLVSHHTWAVDITFAEFHVLEETAHLPSTP